MIFQPDSLIIFMGNDCLSIDVVIILSYLFIQRLNQILSILIKD